MINVSYRKTVVVWLGLLPCSVGVAAAGPQPTPAAAQAPASQPMTQAPAPSVDGIIGAIEGMLAPENVAASYLFTNIRTDGTQARYKVDFKMRDVNKSHAVFLEPEREKGREILRLNDELWTYMPSVGRVVRIADRDSFAGGDFSNADVLRVDWHANYALSLLKDLPNQWIVELKAKTGDAAYAKMLLWVDKKSGQPVQQQYFDSNGTLLKKCLYGETKTFDSITRPGRLVMENVITKQKSELEVLNIKKLGSIPDSRFVIGNLGK